MKREVKARIVMLVSLLLMAGIAAGLVTTQAFAQPEPGTVVASFSSPGPMPTGLTWDGEYLWNADSDTDTIYKLNPSTGSVVSSFPTPGPWPRGLAWDGQYLWNVDRATVMVYKLNPSTGSVVSSFPAPEYGSTGLTWDGEYLWYANLHIDTIYKLNPSTGSVVSSFASPNIYPWDLAWDGEYLWNTDVGIQTIYKLNPSTGSVVSSFPAPASACAGLTWDGEYLWTVSHDTDTIYKIYVGPVSTGVKGIVYYSTTPLSGVKVALSETGTGYDVIPGTITYTDNYGRYTILYDKPGEYWVIGYAPSVEYIDWKGSSVTISAGQVAERNLDLPKKMTLFEPPNGATIQDLTPTLTWRANPEAIWYTLQVNIQSTWELVLHERKITSTGYTFQDPLSEGIVYAWQVDAYDPAYHHVGTTQSAFTFSIAEAPPEPSATVVNFINNYEATSPFDVLTLLVQAFQIGMKVHIADVELGISIEGADQIEALYIVYSTQTSRVYNLSELELSDGVYELPLRFGKPVSDVAEEMAWFIMDVLALLAKGLGPLIFFPHPGETIYPYAEVIEQIVLIDKQGQEIHCGVQDILIPSVYYGFFSTWVKRNGEYELHSQYLVGDYGYGVWASPADLLIIDPEGRRVGTLYQEGMDRQILHEVPGALYSGPDEEPEFILIADPNVGDEYILRLTGTGEGQGSLIYGGCGQTIPSTFEEEEIHISQGEQREYRMNFIPPVSATIDIDPDTLNLESKGKWITCYIELPEGYNVNDIDASTVRLNGFTSAEDKPTEVGDYDDDGILDLMVKFNRSSVQEILEPGGQVKVNVRGKLAHGTLFKGTDTITVIEGGRAETAATHEITQPKFDISQNYPNPFNPATTIEYDIAEGSHVTLKVYSLSGQLVRSLVDEFQPAGHYTITWHGDNEAGQEVASGVYIYHLRAGDFVSTKKMVVLK